MVGSVKMTLLLGLEAGVRAWLCLPTSALEKVRLRLLPGPVWDERGLGTVPEPRGPCA